jgi:hypothetical protein
MEDNGNILARIGTEVHRLTHNTNFETHIFGELWTYNKPWKATESINSNFSNYPEGLMRLFKFVIGE